MEERIIIKGTPQKNKIAWSIMIVGIVLLLASILFGIYEYHNGEMYKGGYYLFEYFVPGYYIPYDSVYDSFVEYFIFGTINVYCYGGYIFIVGLIVAIVGVVMKVKTEKCEITVTNQAIMGKLPHGKKVRIPLNQITAVNPGSFNGISIVSIGNVSNFHCFENRDEVVKAIAYLLANPQQATGHATQSIAGSTAEAAQLKRLKELLDAGVLTQEEFDAKKKQILGL